MDITNASQTEWNGGTLTNIRIHDIREQLKMCAMNKDLNTWLMLLIKMNHELYGFQTPTEKTENRLKLSTLAEAINKHELIKRTIKHRTIGTPAHIIDALNDMEYILDEVFHKSGLQTALKEDAGDSF
jgi:hypothetical protein